MTLLFMDGFDHYATADITKKWTTNSSTTISTTGGRRSSGALLCGIGQYVYKSLSASSSTVIVGAAIKNTFGFSSSWRDAIVLNEGATVHITLAVLSTGKISLYRGTSSSGTLLATGNVTLAANTWAYIEIKTTINSSTGTTEVHINGAVDSGLTLTGANTRNGGTSGVIDTLYIGSGNAMGASYDDLYICDSSGSTNNDFLGDCRIDTILPTGDGNYTQFTPSTGTAHWSLVDESTPNTTDYVSSATSGNRDSYTFPALSSLSSQTIYAVQINAAALKSDAGARSLGTMSRLSSTDKDGTGSALGTSQAYVSEIQETDPASAAWTESNVNSAQFGVKVTA